MTKEYMSSEESVSEEELEDISGSDSEAEEPKKKESMYQTSSLAKWGAQLVDGAHEPENCKATKPKGG